MNRSSNQNLPPYAVAALVVTPEGIPLIRDPKKPLPIFWKLPGGRSELGETAEECMVRELRQEIGVPVAGKDLKKIYEEDRDTHHLAIFRLDFSVMPKLRTHGDEGEEVKVFSARDILIMNDFFPNHRRIVERELHELKK